MRVIGIMSLALATALLSVGCEKANSSSATKPSDTKMDEAQKKAKEAAEAAAAAAKAKRDEYVKDMNKQLDALNVKYEEWKAKAAKAEGQAKKDLENKLDEMKVKRDAATKKLNEVKEASLDRWEKVKEGFGSAFDDLKKIFE
jgi:DNA anti-recombination protein RmuC